MYKYGYVTHSLSGYDNSNLFTVTHYKCKTVCSRQNLITQVENVI